VKGPVNYIARVHYQAG